MRDVGGNVELDELLARRDAIADRIAKIVEKGTREWGGNLLRRADQENKAAVTRSSESVRMPAAACACQDRKGVKSRSVDQGCGIRFACLPVIDVDLSSSAFFPSDYLLR